jgi:organic hydroperoxide reductase OsmC/OhrA
MAKENRFETEIRWTGNRGSGTSNYHAYTRSWDIAFPGKPVVHCSNDPALGGDPTLHNPEELLIAALSACHMLWYLHLCSQAGVTVTGYVDRPTGLGETEPNGAGRFLAVRLKPEITIARQSDADKARALNGEIHKYCFIARSVNFPVEYEPHIVFEQE